MSDAGHRLGHRVLYLQPRVHFNEKQMAIASRRNSTVPAPGSQARQRRSHPCAERLARLAVYHGGGGFLDELLIVSLHRALALAKMNRAPPGVRQNLELDVAAADDRLSR